MLSDLNAVILAGGLGTRLRPVIPDQPKVLAPIRGRPFLGYLLDELARAGVRKVVLCTGHRGEQVEATFARAYGPLSLAYSREDEPSGTGGAIRHALPMLESDPALILNGDSYCGVHLPTFLAWHRARMAKASLVIARVTQPSRYGRVDVSEDECVVRFREKDDESTRLSWVSAGVYLLSQEFMASIPADGACSLERDILPRGAGQGLFAYRVEEPFLDIGTPESYGQARIFFEHLATAASEPGGSCCKDHAVILDRDGIILNVARHNLSDPDRVELLPGASDSLRRLQALGLRLVVLTSQSAVGRGYMDESRLAALHARLQALLGEAGVQLDGVYACPHRPEDRCHCRKPGPGLVERAAADLAFDPRSAFVVGDRACDVELARRIGATAVLVTTGYGRETVATPGVRADFVVDGLAAAADVIGHVVRRAVREVSG